MTTPFDARKEAHAAVGDRVCANTGRDYHASATCDRVTDALKRAYAAGLAAQAAPARSTVHVASDRPPSSEAQSQCDGCGGRAAVWEGWRRPDPGCWWLWEVDSQMWTFLCSAERDYVSEREVDERERAQAAPPVEPRTDATLERALKAGEGRLLPLMMDAPVGMRCCRLAALVPDENAKPTRPGAVVVFHRCPSHGDSAPWETEGTPAPPVEPRATKPMLGWERDKLILLTEEVHRLAGHHAKFHATCTKEKSTPLVDTDFGPVEPPTGIHAEALHVLHELGDKHRRGPCEGAATLRAMLREVLAALDAGHGWHQVSSEREAEIRTAAREPGK